MFVVEMINDILQSIYVYVPQDLFVVILVDFTLIIYESIKNAKKRIKDDTLRHTFEFDFYMVYWEDIQSDSANSERNSEK